MKKYSLFVALLLCSSVATTLASNDFLVSDSVNYKFDSQGLASVTHHFSLTNQTSQLYTKDFVIDLKGFEPKNATAKDSSGKLHISVSGSRYIIHLAKPAVGLGSTHSFTLSYQSQLAARHAQLWEIRLPKLENSGLFNRYELSLTPPQEFGPPASFSVTPVASNQNTFTFSKSQAAHSQITAVFGDFRIVSFSLGYKTDNSRSIPLPSDSSSQKIFLISINPTPKNVIADPSGTWIASFPKSAEVSVSGTAYLLSGEPLSITDTPLLLFQDIQPASYSSPSFSGLGIVWHKPFQFFPLLPISSRLTVTNTTPQAVKFLPVTINSPSLHLTTPAGLLIDPLPPMGHIDLPIRLESPIFPGFSSKFIYFTVGSHALTYNIESGLFIAWHLILGITFSAAIIALGYIAHHAWGLHHERRLRANSLRGQGQTPA